MWEISLGLTNPPPQGEIWHYVPRHGRGASRRKRSHSTTKSTFNTKYHFENLAPEQAAPGSQVPTTITIPDVPSSLAVAIPMSADEIHIYDAWRIFERA